MTRSPASPTQLPPLHPVQIRDEPVVPTDDDASRVAVRPDGYYWVADDGHQEFGPFPTATEALVALRSGIETGLEPDETLQEVEAEIGLVEPRSGETGVAEE